MARTRHHRLILLAALFVGALSVGYSPVSSAPAAGTSTAKKPAAPKPVEFNKGRGYCDAPFALSLTSLIPGATIRFTLDGAEPTSKVGSEYSGPLRITNTAFVRAAAFKGSSRVSLLTTHSYIFLDQVLKQPANPTGLPTAWNGEPAAYKMDPRVVGNPVYQPRIADAFKSLPVVSLVCRADDMFGPRGIYANSMERGSSWERPCSVEMVLPDGRTAFQADCGVRIQGNMNRVPQKSPKHAFRLVFKEQYGPGKLHYQVFPDSTVKKFDTLVLRADFNNSWIHWDPEQRPRAQRIRDAWLKDTARAMGWPAPHTRYVHLFLNGLYWGVYDFTERPDATFAAAYLGGKKDDYDVINDFEAKDGTLDAFNQLKAMKDFSQPGEYRKLQQILNVTNYIDYLLLNYYAGNQDWGEQKNWYAIRRRAPDALFQYVVWDGEQILLNLEDDTIREPYETPFVLAQALFKSAEFRRDFAGRVQKHFFNEGALTAFACASRWRKRAAEVDSAMIAESARWGYYRRSEPFTRDVEYVREQQRLNSFYFPQRTAIVLNQLKSAGLYR